MECHPRLVEWNAALVSSPHTIGDRWCLSWTLLVLEYVVSLQGDFSQAGSCFREVLSLAFTYGNLNALIIALVHTGALLARKAHRSSEPGLLLAARLCRATATYI